MRQQQETYDDSARDISHGDLQKRHIGAVGQSGNADDGQRAGFGGYDRKRNRPPWNVTSGEKVVA